jgi:hypothetical protein
MALLCSELKLSKRNKSVHLHLFHNIAQQKLGHRRLSFVKNERVPDYSREYNISSY